MRSLSAMRHAMPRRGLVGSRRFRRAGRERGAVLIEIAIVSPLLLLLLFATFDLGLGWRDSITISNAARSGARVGTNLGKAQSADHSTLIAVAAALGTIPVSSIDTVIIYKATSTNATPVSSCLSAAAKTAGGNAAGLCNVYDSADVAAVAANPSGTMATYSGSCTGSRPDRFWCPPNRNNVQGSAAGLDFFGVYIKLNRAWKTKVFGSSHVMDDYSVMRIEPNAGN